MAYKEITKCNDVVVNILYHEGWCENEVHELPKYEQHGVFFIYPPNCFANFICKETDITTVTYEYIEPQKPKSRWQRIVEKFRLNN